MGFLTHFIMRSVQMCFGITVLSLSVSLIKGQIIGSAPATTGYDAFVGAFLMLDVFIGMTALGVSFLAGPIMWGIDALVALCALAGGIATAVELKGVSCSDVYGMYYNGLINGGSVVIKGQESESLDKAQLASRCKMNKADTAFLFLGCAITVACLVVGFVSYQRGSLGSRARV